MADDQTNGYSRLSVKIGQCFCRRWSQILLAVITMTLMVYLTPQMFDKYEQVSDKVLDYTLQDEISAPAEGTIDKECNNTKGFKSNQHSGADFLSSWAETKAEFVSSLKTLLSDGAKSTDPRLLSLVRRFMFPPSTKPYKMSYNFGPPPQEEIAAKYFESKGQKEGFFVECGGMDGERLSNTYHLEKAGWQGLLIEADSDYFLQSLGKNRRAWKLNAALCPSREPSIVKFLEHMNSGLGKVASSGNTEVPCIPLAVAMKALNRTRIDFFSLDVEGLEMQILRSIPYKELDIQTITMEYLHDKETPDYIINYMSSIGYKLLQKIDVIFHAHKIFTHDLFFVKK